MFACNLMGIVSWCRRAEGGDVMFAYVADSNNLVIIIDRNWLVRLFDISNGKRGKRLWRTELDRDTHNLSVSSDASYVVLSAAH